MWICSYHKVTFLTPDLTFHSLQAFRRKRENKDMSVQTKCRCPQPSTCIQNNLTIKAGSTGKSRTTWDNLKFSKSQTSFLSLGDKGKGSHLKIWKHTLHVLLYTTNVSVIVSGTTKHSPSLQQPKSMNNFFYLQGEKKIQTRLKDQGRSVRVCFKATTHICRINHIIPATLSVVS